MSKPKFDKSQPFESAPAGDKPKFDPSKKFEAAPEKSVVATSGEKIGKSLIDVASRGLQLLGDKVSQGWKEGLVEGSIAALPAAGGVLGTIAGGGPLSPVGIAGGGLGYAAGKELEGLARRHIKGEQVPDKGLMGGVQQAAENTVKGSALVAGGAGAPAIFRRAAQVYGAVPAPLKRMGETAIAVKALDLLNLQKGRR